MNSMSCSRIVREYKGMELKVRMEASEETRGVSRNQAMEGLLSHTEEFGLHPAGVRVTEGF